MRSNDNSLSVFTPLFAVITVLALILSPFQNASAEIVTYDDSWGNHGFNLISQDASGLEIVFSVNSFSLDEITIEGEVMTAVRLPGVFLPNDEGAPDLPGMGRWLAIPCGAEAALTVVAQRKEVIRELEIAPAHNIPAENDDSPLIYRRNPDIYSRDAYYPRSPVMLSEPTQIRGVDVVIIGVTPFQYNPVTRELAVYRDLRVRVDFIGGSGHFGEDRLRSRYWEPILKGNLLNFASLPEVDMDRLPLGTDETNVEYLIIVPNDPTFIAWADTLKQWRLRQGIITGITTLNEIGGNDAVLIQNYIDNAYSSWTIPPAAVLLLSDYQNSGDSYGITAPVWSGSGGSCVSDNIYADVSGNNLPDIIFARITAQNEAHLAGMVGKLLDYERTPPTNAHFYNCPLIAGGWQTERWFILCTEIVYGYLQNELNKTPVREYAIYQGAPGSVWSTTDPTAVVNYFGPSGLGYIPQTPAYLTNWTGSASGINLAINSGAFIVQHRDHGSETGWGEPNYHSNNLTALRNNDYTFVFSINCLTGKYNNPSAVFTEVFHRHQYGALGVIAASEVSYSFVNDTYVWGMYDSMWPNFDPGYGTDETGPNTLRPGFANASGKYYLQASNWPYNYNSKPITYHLFHMHGDAFTTLYSEMPRDLTVSHSPALEAGADFFTVEADSGALVALTADGAVIGVGESSGAPLSVSIIPQTAGGSVTVTVTLQNYYRYIQNIPVVPSSAPLTVSMEPVNPPVVIPANGGSFECNVSITNNENSPAVIDGWIDVTLPNGSNYGPVILRQSLTIHAGATITRTITQFVPSYAPAGEYTYWGRAGTHPSTALAEDSFRFTKSASESSGGGSVDDWYAAGWEESDFAGLQPEKFELWQNYPNPFNPLTNIDFALPQGSMVTLEVFNIVGERTAVLYEGYMKAGFHSLVWNASELPSGVYFYRLDAGSIRVVKKCVLLK